MAFARIYDWTDDRDNGVKITASRVDEEMDRLTSNDNLLANSQPQWGGTDTGTASAFAITVSPTPSALQAGQAFRWIAGRDNNGPTATLNVNSLGAKPIKMGGTTTINTAAVLSGAMYESVYDGSAQYTHRVDFSDQYTPALFVTGSANLNGATVIGDATADTLVINAAASAQSPFVFANAVTLNSAATFNAALTINAPVTFVSGTAHFNATTVIGDATTDSLKINAITTAESPFVHNGATTFNSSATFNGSVTLGDATADTLKINAVTTAESSFTFNNAVTFNSSTTFLGAAGALRSKVLVVGKALAAATTSTSYTGVGFQPTSVKALAVKTNENAFSIGFSDASANQAVIFFPGPSFNNAALIVVSTAAGGASQIANITGYSADGFAVQWAQSGTLTGSADVFFLCER